MEFTESEIKQLDVLFKEEFPTCKFVVPYSLYGQLNEKSKKLSVLVEDSRVPAGFMLIKKKYPSLKQIII
jgi:hypothetical protein